MLFYFRLSILYSLSLSLSLSLTFSLPPSLFAVSSIFLYFIWRYCTLHWTSYILSHTLFLLSLSLSHSLTLSPPLSLCYHFYFSVLYLMLFYIRWSIFYSLSLSPTFSLPLSLFAASSIFLYCIWRYSTIQRASSSLSLLHFPPSLVFTRTCTRLPKWLESSEIESVTRFQILDETVFNITSEKAWMHLLRQPV